MTREQLEAIRADLDARWQCCSPPEEGLIQQARALLEEAERLTAIVDRLATMDPIINGRSGEICGLCLRMQPPDDDAEHNASCLWQAAQQKG